ncbi:hypothetical protein [Deinococcus humi]|uniref:Uncharacterized protein n=1 Tax=Deinococcus humi TaxID=662880 RepID=A0A7W8JW50_9DEIO|nr:hypothetical protein [Deinococcus humi]MBB5362739.1 hypothetical protein [Deinococcus humi]GGO30919.1 hypothetical protein GCM10008949_26080 [Deinococcus humi]
MTDTQNPQSQTDKGTRGHELDIHVTFAHPLPEAQALAALLVLDGFRVELYRPHPAPTRPPGEPVPEPEETPDIPSARLTGPLRDPEAVRAGLSALLGKDARYVEVGVRGFLRSTTGQTDWMPWRTNKVLKRTEAEKVGFEEAVRYVLE